MFELAEGMAQRGIEVEVLCADLGSRRSVERHGAGYLVTRVASWGRVLATSVAPAMFGEFRRARRGCDIVHVHMPNPLAALALWFSPPAGKLVVHWHSDVVRQRLSRRLYEPLQRWLLARADSIIATSHAYAASSPWLRRWPGKTVVVPIGIGDNAGRRDAAASEAIRRRFGHRRIVFSLGRMSHYKGFDVLIDAAALLPDHCVVVVGGEGELLERHRQCVVERNLTGKIVFVGKISDQDLPAYFDAARVFCLASTLRSEAYGVVIAEAMAMGKPVVATDIAGSGVPWVNADHVTGLNVPVEDAPALAAALRITLDDGDLAARYGQAARQRYETLFTADGMVEATVRLYDRVLETGTPSPLH
ncbi:MAG: glycosyltransferase [Pseudomonadota bacterium]|nr:glycosyltransferase [Pseudomonadota bacterium]